MSMGMKSSLPLTRASTGDPAARTTEEMQVYIIAVFEIKTDVIL